LFENQLFMIFILKNGKNTEGVSLFFYVSFFCKKLKNSLYLSSKIKKMESKSPFPGMNPWLEGYLWSDVHHDLASAIRALLAPQIAPKYVSRIAIATVTDSDPESEFGITYPDVEVLKRNNILEEPVVAYGKPVLTEPTVIAPFKPITLRLAVVEIRDTANNKLVTAIEILSPVNKRNPNIEDYRTKIKNLHKNGVHILEIDLLRRGTRPFVFYKSTAHYQMMLLRGGTSNAAIWSVNVQDKLPVLPVPLLAPDPDVILELGKALDIIFERSLYHLSLDYAQTPAPPVFSETDLAWISEIVK
jgi:Protein of unknown function (DUF4058)